MNEFEKYGLSKEHNLLSGSDFGFEQKDSPIFETDMDLYDFFKPVVKYYIDDNCAVFAVNNDGSKIMVMKLNEYDKELDDYIPYVNVGTIDKDTALSEVVESLKIKEYGLLIEQGNKAYRICE